jgi:lysine 6-dehydrogenase
MRVLVLGAGQQGSACAYDLLTNSSHQIVLADLDPERVPEFLQPYVGGRLELRRLDAADPDAVREVMQGAVATMSALPYYFNLTLAEAALEAGSHFCDLGGNTDIVLDQKALHDQAVEAGISIVPDCGLAPGMVNILAEHGIRRLERPHEVHLKVGGLPQNPEPPLKYQIVYSLEGVIDYYTTLSWILRDGRLLQIQALSEVEEVFFPEIGALEAFHTAGGLSLMAQSYAGRVDRMEYKTLRYPGHAEAMRTVRELGLLSTDPLDVKGVTVSPRDVFIAAAGPRLRKDPQKSPDLVALRVEVRGEQEGRDTTLRWELIDRYDPATGITAMMRTTGFSLSITALLQVAGRIRPGAWTPDEVVPAQEYLRELAGRGIRVVHELS